MVVFYHNKTIKKNKGEMMGKFNKGVSTSFIRIGTDVAMCLISYVTAAMIFGIPILSRECVMAQLVFCIVYVLASKGYRMYNVTTFYYVDRIFRLVSTSFLTAVGVTSMAVFLVGKATVATRLYLTFLGLSYILLLANAICARKYMKKFYELSAPRTILMGREEQYEKFHRFVDQSNIPIKEVGYVSCNKESNKNQLGSIDDLDDVIHSYGIDQVYIMHSDSEKLDVKSFVSRCMEMGVTVNVLHHCSHIESVHTFTSSCGTYPVVTYHTVSLNKYNRTIKRIVDVIGSICGIILSSPIMLGVALAIKISSPGPVLFKQVRVGLNGRRFKIYKFRSMYIDAEERKKELMAQNELKSNLMFKMKDDPRITKVGKFIRKTSLDELPQFFNVLFGDMSLVGTRPPTVDEVEYYERWHWKRMSIKPGITGMWQVSGRSSITDFQKIVELDIEYISNWNVFLDIKILFKTVAVLLKREGAC